MNPYMALKRCLIDGWPDASLSNCAAMVLLDTKTPGNGIGIARIEDLFHTVKMPISRAKSVSVYLAACYPKTSAALFDARPKDECFKILLNEKHINPSARNSIRTFARKEYKAQVAAAGGVTWFIRARTLSKKHDWNTVK